MRDAHDSFNPYRKNTWVHCEGYCKIGSKSRLRECTMSNSLGSSRTIFLCKVKSSIISFGTLCGSVATIVKRLDLTMHFSPEADSLTPLLDNERSRRKILVSVSPGIFCVTAIGFCTLISMRTHARYYI